MIYDIHSHTYYSFCGRDDPHVIIDAAIAGGLEAFGICDHNYGITRSGDEGIPEYLAHLTSLRDEYAGKIILLRGIELCTNPSNCLSDTVDVSGFDYALVENIDQPDSVIAPHENTANDGIPRDGGSESGIFAYAKRLGCKTGIAHSDLFAFADKIGVPAEDFLRRLAEAGIFWEMNVSFDSIHSYREHQYVKNLIASELQRDIVRRSGIELSVGFDGHRVEDYRPDRVSDMCRFIDENGLRSLDVAALYKAKL